MGEGFKRKRAQAFLHQRSKHYQALLSLDLFSVARQTSAPGVEIRAFATGAGLEPGTRCLIVSDSVSGLCVLVGNNRVASITAESAALLDMATSAAERPNGLLPCEVTRVDPFGGISLRISSEDWDE